MLRRVCSVRRAFAVQYSYRAAAQLVAVHARTESRRVPVSECGGLD